MKLIYVVLMGVMVLPVSPWPEGPPITSCLEMNTGTAVGAIGMEGHTSLPMNYQPGKNSQIAPYFIQIHNYNDHYLPDTDYKVSIVANQTFSSNYFMGVFLQARKVLCAGKSTVIVDEMPIGTFSIPYTTTQSLLQTMDCAGMSSSAVSHRSRQFKINETVTWRSPSDITGPIVLRMTIVKEATVYWTEQNSIIMLDSQKTQPQSCRGVALQLPSVLVISAYIFVALNI